MATIGPVSTSTRAGLSLTSSAAKSVEVPRIRAEVPSCPFHRSDQIGLFRMFVCGECIPLGGELTLYRGANQVGLKRSAARRGGTLESDLVRTAVERQLAAEGDALP